MTISSVLVANRGEIALRVVRTCREMGIRTVVAHSTADRDSAGVWHADSSVQIGPPAAKRSYLNVAAVVSAALQSGVDAVHPGYGFLSEDADFAEACESNGLVFIGPPAKVLIDLADKARARQVAAAAGLPVLPGGMSTSPDANAAKELAAEIGYPVIIKAVAGGGGRGMTVVREPEDFLTAYARTRATAQAVFGDPGVYIERYLDVARHIEVQVLADRYGNAVHLGARDCSVQRSRQKLLEEAPPPGLPADVAERMAQQAVEAARHMGYVGAGTFEFLVDEENRFHFMEINCRIQVEHPVTEAIVGMDLVREQLLVASGEPLTVTQDGVLQRGAAIECRINAEDPARGFLPTPGTIDEFAAPAGPFTRVDSHCHPHMRVTPYYDSLLAKVIVWAPDRAQAIARMDRALREAVVRSDSVHTTIEFLQDVLAHPLFLEARHTTTLVDAMLAPPPTHTAGGPS
ncbi:acetyl-CoA carboxylase biotin carboxylase subunit [Phytohabitans aurantiacus]|jgi:acetyl-CoA carboxylase biotin carboxylase subunit|uniref:biotin carboxylase n=1 Tax=Phytohabitans aurantiacus TaxID=3016789 RepID=A0ABQ5QXM5_9ACTN|nr:acetyl-CoA carboxylase biotin carboxylase subunit [Phytohabitans aurantiacus]GLH99298.1 acetyl-CoA carboxylase biotin carboxylase subunit [Phytohabitans aurantiacus]